MIGEQVNHTRQELGPGQPRGGEREVCVRGRYADVRGDGGCVKKREKERVWIEIRNLLHYKN